MKARSVEVSMEAEAEEECMMNKLTRRLAQLRKEKELLANAVEREEEALTNNLQRQLMQLKKEKVSLENQLEAEHESVVNRLRKHLSSVERENTSLQKTLEGKVEEYPGQEAIEDLQRLVGSDAAVAAAIAAVNMQLVSDAKVIVDLRSNIDMLSKENTALRDEGFLLKRRIEQEHETRERAENEKISLQSAVEADDERMFNSMSRTALPTAAPPPPVDTSAGVVEARASLLEIMQTVRDEASAESSALLDEDGCLTTSRSPKFPPRTGRVPLPRSEAPPRRATVLCADEVRSRGNPRPAPPRASTPRLPPGTHSPLWTLHRFPLNEHYNIIFYITEKMKKY